MLELQGLHKSFGGFAAIGGVSLSVEDRRITAIIGPNGAGKSTLFNLVTGHLRPTSGRVLLDGQDVTGQAPYHLCRKGMGRSFQRANIFSRLTVFENVQAALLSHGERGWDLWSRRHELYRAETEEVLESVGLADKAEAPSASLSYGNQKQLELGIALASKPKLLLLDEPTAGMSSGETAETIALIERIVAERGLTLLFTEHDMSVVFSIAQKIAVLHQGRLIAEGRPDEVRANADVRRVYLGERG